MILPAWLSIAGGFLRRFWYGVPIAVLAILLFIRTDQRDDARSALKAERASFAAFRSDVQAATEVARRRDAENVARVQQAQSTITEEVSRDYQARIADLSSRVAALRVRNAAPDVPGRSGTAAVPAARPAPGGVDAAAVDPGLSFEERIVATEQALRLQALQFWVRRQGEIVPSAEPDSVR